MAVLNHGTVRGYKSGCRCDECKAANTAAKARERDRRREREGKAPARTPASKRVPTKPSPAPTPRRPELSGDHLTRIIEEVIFELGGSLAAAKVAADRLRDAGYVQIIDAPIELAARRALPQIGGDSDLSTLRRETAYRAAAVMDNPKAAPFFKSAAEVLRITVEDLIAAAPAKDGEGDAVKELMASFSSRGRTRRGAPVDDSKESA